MFHPVGFAIPTSRHGYPVGPPENPAIPDVLVDSIAAFVYEAVMAGAKEQQVVEIRALHEEGGYAASIQMLEALLDQDPDHPELNQLYGVALV